jgi:hypothetical protein
MESALYYAPVHCGNLNDGEIFQLLKSSRDGSFAFLKAFRFCTKKEE